MKHVIDTATVMDECPYCEKSGHVAYNKKHDASYCTSCGKWLDSACSDPTCLFCADRPATCPDKRGVTIDKG